MTGYTFSGHDSHAHSLSYNLLDKAAWKGTGVGNLGSGQVNFLQEARLDKAQALNTEDSIEDLEEEEEKQVKRRKKQKVNVYEFFEEMRQMGLRPPSGHPDPDMDLT